MRTIIFSLKIQINYNQLQINPETENKCQEFKESDILSVFLVLRKNSSLNSCNYLMR